MAHEMHYIRLFYVSLAPHHLRPGGVQRRVVGWDGEAYDVPYPVALSIEKIQPDDEEVMIRLLDEHGRELTHSHAFSLDVAFEDALYEFGIERSEWIVSPAR